MEKYQLAYSTFERILDLVFLKLIFLFIYLKLKDSKNINAIMGIGILEFRKENYKKYYEMLEKAYKIDNKFPLLYLHLAEREYYLQNHEKVKIHIKFHFFSNIIIKKI